MSKYLTYTDITFANRELLLQALADCGYSTVEEGQALPLYGYQGDRRDETAEIVVRRQHIGRSSNDVGFKLTEAGYVPIVSQYDQRFMHGGKFIPKLRTAYGERFAAQLSRNVHGTLTRTTEGSKVKIVIRP